MSRKRQQERQKGRLMEKIKKHDETCMYHLTPLQLKEIIDKNVDGTNRSDRMVFALALHNEFGFGKKRIERLLRRVRLQYECVGNTLDPDDVFNFIKSKNIDIDAK